MTASFLLLFLLHISTSSRLDRLEAVVNLKPGRMTTR